MSNQSLPVKSDMYHILEKADEYQIRAADEKVKEALVYEVHGDYHLSYAGVKHLSLLMSQKGQPLKIVNAEVEIRKDGDLIEALKYIPNYKEVWGEMVPGMKHVQKQLIILRN